MKKLTVLFIILTIIISTFFITELTAESFFIDEHGVIFNDMPLPPLLEIKPFEPKWAGMEGHQIEDVISISNILSIGNVTLHRVLTEDRTIPFYTCSAPLEITALENAKMVYIDRIRDGYYRSMLSDLPYYIHRIDFEGQLSIWDASENKEKIINYENIADYTLDREPKIIAGAKAKLTESGYYTVKCLTGYVDAIIHIEEGIDAIPNESNVLVNGKKVSFDAYNINGNNYFKLRDLAFVLNGTERQFAVTYISEKNEIILSPGIEYESVGGEMSQGKSQVKEAKPSSINTFLLDDTSNNVNQISLKAYTIAGNTYFMLRDIGKTFNFGVFWDGESKSIIIDTSSPYIE